MAARVILLGATGYTGRLVAEAMVAAGLAPVLAGRRADALVDLVGDLAGLGPMAAAPTWAVADVSDPASVRALLRSPRDVLVSTVGPFSALGRAAVDTAVDQGCAYVDCSGEPAFLRRVFEQDDARARRSGARLLPAFGYDYLPGNLAAAVAIDRVRAAGRTPTVVQVGYFTTGAAAMSRGTRASVRAAALGPPLSRRGGALSTAFATPVEFDVDGRRLIGLPTGGSEVFAVPRRDRGVRDVEVAVGWAGRWTPWAGRAQRLLSSAAHVPALGPALSRALAPSAASHPPTGPDAAARARSGSLVVARVSDGVGRVLEQVVVDGPNGYTLTAEALAWAAAMLGTDRHRDVGVLGPVDAFGLPDLTAGCATFGVHVRAIDR